jgi:type IV pilus assembly protein PilA
MDTHAHDDDGFTLIELMVVIGIVGVLIAIMIPTLLQARRPAQDRQAQNLLRNSLTAAKAIETSEGAIATATALGTEESAVSYVGGTTNAPANRRLVSVANPTVGGVDFLILASFASSGRCFAILEQAQHSPQFQRVDSAATCQASQFDTTTGWSSAWP